MSTMLPEPSEPPSIASQERRAAASRARVLASAQLPEALRDRAKQLEDTTVNDAKAKENIRFVNDLWAAWHGFGIKKHVCVMFFEALEKGIEDAKRNNTLRLMAREWLAALPPEQATALREKKQRHFDTSLRVTAEYLEEITKRQASGLDSTERKRNHLSHFITSRHVASITQEKVKTLGLLKTDGIAVLTEKQRHNLRIRRNKKCGVEAEALLKEMAHDTPEFVSEARLFLDPGPPIQKIVPAVSAAERVLPAALRPISSAGACALYQFKSLYPYEAVTLRPEDYAEAVNVWPRGPGRKPRSGGGKWEVLVRVVNCFWKDPTKSERAITKDMLKEYWDEWCSLKHRDQPAQKTERRQKPKRGGHSAV